MANVTGPDENPGRRAPKLEEESSTASRQLRNTAFGAGIVCAVLFIALTVAVLGAPASEAVKAVPAPAAANPAASTPPPQPVSPPAPARALPPAEPEPEPHYLEDRFGQKRPDLVQAAVECNPANASQLLHSGANPNEVDPSGDTALIWAVKRGCVPVARVLLQNGADKEIPSSNGLTALSWARRYKSIELEKLLDPPQALRNRSLPAQGKPATRQSKSSR